MELDVNMNDADPQSCLLLLRFLLLLPSAKERVVPRWLIQSRKIKTPPEFDAPVRELRQLITKCRTSISASSPEDQIDAMTNTSKPSKLPKGPSKTNHAGEWQSMITFDIAVAQRLDACPFCQQKTVNAIDSPGEIERKNKLVIQRHQSAVENWAANDKKGNAATLGQVCQAGHGLLCAHAELYDESER
jgi:hypothetical protein